MRVDSTLRSIVVYLMRILGLRNVRHEALLLAVEVDEDEADQHENAHNSCREKTHKRFIILVQCIVLMLRRHSP